MQDVRKLSTGKRRVVGRPPVRNFDQVVLKEVVSCPQNIIPNTQVMWLVLSSSGHTNIVPFINNKLEKIRGKRRRTGGVESRIEGCVQKRCGSQRAFSTQQFGSRCWSYRFLVGCIVLPDCLCCLALPSFQWFKNVRCYKRQPRLHKHVHMDIQYVCI